MIWILTIIIALIILWSIFSIFLLLENGDSAFGELYPWNSFEDVICNLAIIYWSSLIVIGLGSILLFISYLISSSIICYSSNDDSKYCAFTKNIIETIKENNNE